MVNGGLKILDGKCQNEIMHHVYILNNLYDYIHFIVVLLLLTQSLTMQLIHQLTFTSGVCVWVGSMAT